MKPHVSYLPILKNLLGRSLIKGLAHITGGGLLENIPRILPEGTAVEIQNGSWPVLPVFNAMQRIGNIEKAEMFRTFNMGIGMIVVGARADVSEIKSHVESLGETCYVVGQVIAGDKRVHVV